MRKWLPFAFLAGILAWSLMRTRGGPEEGIPAPEFALTAVDGTGRTIRLADRGDRPMIVEVFAGWCSSCRGAAPVVKEAAERFGDRVAFLGVSVDEDSREAARTVDAWGIRHPVGLDNGNFAAAYKIRSLPTFVVIDRRGVIAHVLSGVPSPATIERWVEDAL